MIREALKEVTLKSGKIACVRYPVLEDLEKLLEYQNELSAEDTFLISSGEQFSKEEYLPKIEKVLWQIKEGHRITLIAEIDGKIAGRIDIKRCLELKARAPHVAKLGMSVRKEFRGQGLGRSLLKVGIEEAKKNISGLKMIILGVFGNNTTAITLYKSEGFVECGRLKGGILYRGKYVDNVKMVLFLGQ